MGSKEVDYLGFCLTPSGVKPQTKKVEAIVRIQAPRTRKQLRFIGLVNYYRYMWKRRSHIIAPLATLCSKSVKFQWNKEHQKAFDEIKNVVSKEVLLTFPDYTKPFEVINNWGSVEARQQYISFLQ